jgi:FkbM family methyltransferase
MRNLIPRNFFEKNDTIIIYGIGNSNKVFRSFVLNKISKINSVNVLLTVDRQCDDTPQLLKGVMSASSRYFESNIDLYRNIPIIICIGSNLVAVEVAKWLHSLGCKTIIDMHDFEDFHCSYDDTPFYSIQNDISKFANEIQLIDELIEDDLSREVFGGFISSFSKRVVPNIPSSDLKFEQIEPGFGFLKFLNGSKILNCGAYTGDSLSRISQNTEGVADQIFLLEPSLHNYGEMLKILPKINLVAKEILALPLGVSSKTEVTSFPSEGGVVSDTSALLDVDYGLLSSVDQMFYGIHFTHFIVDIEGAEKEFLEGAKNTIINFRPKICIAAYHYPIDIILIPLFLMKLDVGYKFYFRNYSSFISDTLIYAIPDNM